MVQWPELESLLLEKCDSITVMNFWATWCKPCVAELPYFEKLRKEMAGSKVRFVYVSLDFADEQTKRLDPFIERKLSGARVWLLNETDYNQWIGKLDPGWSGGIPATLFYHHSTKKRIFAEGELSDEKLRSNLKSVLSITE